VHGRSTPVTIQAIMIGMSVSIIQIPEAWREDYPDRATEIESLGHSALYGEDPDCADVTLWSEEDWDNFLCDVWHPVDERSARQQF
jgi:hypothetical protein